MKFISWKVYKVEEVIFARKSQRVVELMRLSPRQLIKSKSQVYPKSLKVVLKYKVLY